jgi:hypothetical protein
MLVSRFHSVSGVGERLLSRIVSFGVCDLKTLLGTHQVRERQAHLLHSLVLCLQRVRCVSLSAAGE